MKSETFNISLPAEQALLLRKWAEQEGFGTISETVRDCIRARQAAKAAEAARLLEEATRRAPSGDMPDGLVNVAVKAGRRFHRQRRPA